MNKLSTTIATFILLFLISVSMLFITTCTPPSTIYNKKVLVTNQGEIIEDTRYPGEEIKFKIYYWNKTNASSTIVIVDTISTVLENIRVSDDGNYIENRQIAYWVIKNVAADQKGTVEFKANIKSNNVMVKSPIKNRAMIYFIKGREGFDFDIKNKPLQKIERESLVDSILTNFVYINICERPKLGWIPFKEDVKPDQKPERILKDETTTGTLVYFGLPGMFVREVTLEGQIFHKITIPTLSQLGDLGKPELPVIGKAIEIPRGVKYSLEIYKADSIVFDCYNVLPAQIPEPEEYTKDEKFVIDSSLYKQNSFYPNFPAFIKDNDDAIIRGHRVAFLKVSPIKFNPVTNQLIAYSRIEVRIKYDQPAKIEPVDKRIMSPVFEELLSASIENFKVSERFADTEAPPGDYKRGCDYLVITPAAFYNSNDPNNSIRRLCEWKHRKGLLTDVETIENIGNTAANIRTFMQDAYDTWNPVPSYVVLIGDADHIIPDYRTDHPSRGHNVNIGTPGERATQIGTDLYYATLDGTDYFPDVFLSRISVDDANDLENIVNKILTYEQNPPANANFYNNTSLVRLFEDDSPSDAREDNVWILIELAEEMHAFLTNQGYNSTKIYNFSGTWTGPPAGPQRWENGSNLPDRLTQQPPIIFQWNGNTNDIVNAFNNGNFMITYRGHGLRGGWGHPSFRIANLGALNQNDFTPAVFCPTCQAGWFDDETDDALLNSNNDCFAEEILRLDGCGAIGVIASSRNSWGRYNNPMVEGICDALWTDFDENSWGGYLPRFGQILSYSKIYMASNEADANGRLVTFEMTHLFGDPELPMWVEEPGDLSVNHPAGVGTTGLQEFVVKVIDNDTKNPVQSAVVAVTSSNSIISVKQTDIGGNAYFSLQNIDEGNLDLTVTHVRFRPYMGNILAVAKGADFNILNPENGIVSQQIFIGGNNFFDDEQVQIYFGSQLVSTVNVQSGSFGQTNNVTINVPSSFPIGPYTIMGNGVTSNRYATRVFKVRTAQAAELYIYSQFDQSTWHLYQGDNPTWNNPDIWMENQSGDVVASNNLVVGDTYTIKARIHNDSDNNANAVYVAFKWSEFGVGQQVWTDIGNSAPINVNSNNTGIADVKWTPTRTGHICVIATVYHPEDILDGNNIGQENCHVGPTSSPVRVSFNVCNPTDEPAMVNLELRQIELDNVEGEKNVVWGTFINQPDPQLIKPGECREANVIIDPDLSIGKVNSGQIAKFAITAYIKGKIVGGVNFEIEKK